MNNIFQSTKRPYVIAPTPSQKQRTLDAIDRACSLYYVTMGSVYAVCQTAMVDARQTLRTLYPSLFRHQVKYSVNKALAAYDRWNATMHRTLGARYQMWLDVSDAVDDEVRPMLTALYYSIDNFFLLRKMPCSKAFSAMETARILLEFAGMFYRDLFDKLHRRIGVDLRPMFRLGDAADIFRHWNDAIDAACRMVPSMPDINVNDDPTIRQAVDNIIRRLTDCGIYNRSGEYALRLNPDQWHTLDKESRMRLKRGLPIGR